jgi:hypothetical protein
MPSIMTAAQRAAYERDGFVIVPGMFDRAEIDLLQQAMERDPAVRDHMIDRADANGAATRISLWNRAGDSVYGLAARCLRMVDTMEEILGDTLNRADDRYYVPLDKVPDDAIKAAGLKFSDGVGEHFASKPFVPKVTVAAE